MSDPALIEEPLQFGDGGRLSGILTLGTTSPRTAAELPVFVFLNAGLLHRVGPHRLYVRLARELSRMGFSSLRVDLAGTGNSPRRAGLTYQQSVAEDFREISGLLESRLGRLPLVLAGLCSGAHDAVRLTPAEPRVVGMVLLDPVCFPDIGFRARGFVQKYGNYARYIVWLRRRLEALTAPRTVEHVTIAAVDAVAPRNDLTWAQFQAAWGIPDREQLRTAFESIHQRDGRVISIFTQSALNYYNHTGQLRRILGLAGYQQFCTELFWPQAEHTYTLELHRHRLIGEIKAWAAGFIRS